MAVDFESSNDGELSVKSNGAFRRTFKFDAVFGPQSDQGNCDLSFTKETAYLSWRNDSTVAILILIDFWCFPL